MIIRIWKVDRTFISLQCIRRALTLLPVSRPEVRHLRVISVSASTPL